MGRDSPSSQIRNVLNSYSGRSRKQGGSERYRITPGGTSSPRLGTTLELWVGDVPWSPERDSECFRMTPGQQLPMMRHHPSNSE